MEIPKTETESAITLWIDSAFPPLLIEAEEKRRRINRLLEETAELCAAESVRGVQSGAPAIGACLDVFLKCYTRAYGEYISGRIFPSVSDEIADIYIALVAFASRSGMTVGFAVDMKMQTNRARSWEYYESKTAAKTAQGL